MKKVTENLSNRAVLHCICMNGKRCFESLAILLSSELMECQILTTHKQRFFKCKLPPQTFNLHSLHDHFCGWNCCRPIPFRRALHRKQKGFELCFKGRSVKKHSQTSQQTAVDIEAAHSTAFQIGNKKYITEKKRRRKMKKMSVGTIK